jgi:hypothetical protein
MAQIAVRFWPGAALHLALACSTIVGQEPRPTFRPGSKAAPREPSPESLPPARSPVTPRGPVVRSPDPGGPAEKAPRTTASSEQISAWIRELDADEFFSRETAMLQLLDAGPAVLPSLKPVLTGGTLEATSRALFVVRQIGLTADIDTQDEAGELLTELAARDEAPALARRAAAALQELTEQRSAKALNQLEELGARIARSQIIGGLPIDDSALSIEVNDTFRGTADDMRRLKWVTGVPILILSGKQITDEWVQQASNMQGLEELHLYQARISDAGLAPLADLPALRQVGLYYTPVTEAALQPLIKAPLLGFVKLYGTKVAEAGKNKFKAASGVAVDFRRGAFLGVGGIDIDGTCLISSVHDGSPAAKAGLLREDVIVRFGKEAVGNFSSLTDLISQYDAGDEIEIEVARRVIDDHGVPALRTISTKVVLAPWELEPAVRNARR